MAKLKKLSQEDWAWMHGYYTGMYLHGHCFAFAIALNQSLGWQLVALYSKNTIIHVMVREPTGVLRDFRGIVKYDEIGKPYHMDPPYKLRKVSRGELEKIEKQHAINLNRAQEIAEILWPDLPYRKRRNDKYLEFVKELEKLSKRTGVWISLPPSPQMISLSRDDGETETTYILRPNTCGVTFSLGQSHDHHQQ